MTRMDFARHQLAATLRQRARSRFQRRDVLDRLSPVSGVDVRSYESHPGWSFVQVERLKADERWSGPFRSAVAVLAATVVASVLFEVVVHAGATTVNHPTPSVLNTQSLQGAGNPGSNYVPPSSSDSVNDATGDFWHTFTDASIPGRGVALDLTRTYNSSSGSTLSPFGYAWSSSYTMSLAVSGSAETVTQEDGSQIVFNQYVAPAGVYATLSTNSNGTYSFVRRAISTFVFSSSGQLVSESDPNGYTTTLSYSSNHLTTVTDPEGRALSFAYGTNGLVSSVTDPLGRVISYAYNSSKDLTSVTDPASRVTSFTYDSSNDVLTTTDPDGGVTTNVYGAGPGQLTKQTDPAGLASLYAYSGNNAANNASSGGGTTTITDPHGSVTTQSYQYDLLLKQTRASGTSSAATTSYTYDSNYNQASVTDPNGHTTSKTYDTNGNVLTSTDAFGNMTTYSYNSLGEQTVVTDPLGMTTSNMYDAQGNLLSKRVQGSLYGSSWSGGALGSSSFGFGTQFCLSSSFCAAFGNSAGNSYAYIYNGSSWSGSQLGSALTPDWLKCVSPSFCAAFATSNSGSIPYAYIYNGSSWSGGALGSSSFTPATYTLTCLSSNFCAAIGRGIDKSIYSYVYNGSSWSGSQLGSATNLTISSVSCLSSTFCAVFATRGSGSIPYAYIYNGSAWSGGALGSSSFSLFSLTCLSSSFCAAAGQGTNNTVYSYIYNGNSWIGSQLSPGSGSVSQVSCLSSSFCAVIAANLATSYAYIYNGSSWSGGALSSDGFTVRSFRCLSSTFCAAIGLSSANNVDSFIYNGSSWSGGTSTEANLVFYQSTCLSSSFCVTIAENPSTGTSYVYVFNGSSWSDSQLGSSSFTPYTLNCLSSTFCAEVGQGTSNSIYSYIYNGSSWSGTQLSSTTNVSLSSVSCLSSSFCAVFANNSSVVSAPYAFIYNGSSWSGGAIYSGYGPVFTLSSLTCLSSSFCAAIGQGTSNSIYSYIYNGSSWSGAELSSVAGAIYGVSCLSSSFCAAFADNNSTGIPYAFTDSGTPSATTTYAYGDSHPGDLTQVTDPAGHVTNYTYDSYGDVATTTVNPSSGVTMVAQDVYDADGEKVCGASASAQAQGISCPSAGSPRVAGTSTWTYNADRQVLTGTDPLGNSTSYTYNNNGDALTVTDPLGNVTKANYDLDDRVTSTTTGYGTSFASTTSHAYDIVPGTSPCSSSVTGALYCTTSTNGNSQVTVDYYNAASEKIETVAPGGITTTFTYDPAGNQLTKTTAAGTITDAYDADNRVTSVSYSGTASGYSAPSNVTYTFNADGERTSMTDGTGTTSYTYDPLGRLVSTTNGAGSTVSYGYDLDGEATSIRYPGGKTAYYAYDGAGEMTGVTDFQGRTSTFSYSPTSSSGGPKLAASYANGTAITTSADADGNGVLLSATSPSLGISYTRNADDCITGESVSVSGTTYYSVGYGHNSNNQASSSSATGLSNDTGSFGYDGAGNPTSVVSPTSGSAVTQTFNSSQELTQASTSSTSVTYGYDSIGDRTSMTISGGSSSAYTYGQFGEMASETPTGGSTVQYTYNGDGLRMAKTTSSTTEAYTYSTLGSVPLLLVDGSASFIYGPGGGVLEQEDTSISGNPVFYVHDALGSTQWLLNLSGSVVGTYAYSLYGSTLQHTGMASTPIGFAGAYTDSETGLLYLDNRYYDPVTGEFTSVDPLSSLTSVGKLNEGPVATGQADTVYQALLGSTAPLQFTGVAVASGLVFDPAKENYSYDTTGEVVYAKALGSPGVALAGVSSANGLAISGSPFPTTWAETYQDTGSVADPGAVSQSYYDSTTGLTRLGDGYFTPEAMGGLGHMDQVAPSGNPYAYANDNPACVVDPTGMKGVLSIVNAIVGIFFGALTGTVCEAATVGLGSLGCGIIAGFSGTGMTSGLDNLEHVK